MSSSCGPWTGTRNIGPATLYCVYCYAVHVPTLTDTRIFMILLSRTTNATLSEENRRKKTDLVIPENLHNSFEEFIEFFTINSLVLFFLTFI